MIGLSVVLLALGVFAAWNVNKQQQMSSDLIMREMHAMLAIEDIHIEMRDVRYLVNLFLRFIGIYVGADKADPIVPRVVLQEEE